MVYKNAWLLLLWLLCTLENYYKILHSIILFYKRYKSVAKYLYIKHVTLLCLQEITTFFVMYVLHSFFFLIFNIPGEMSLLQNIE